MREIEQTDQREIQTREGAKKNTREKARPTAVADYNKHATTEKKEQRRDRAEVTRGWGVPHPSLTLHPTSPSPFPARFSSREKLRSVDRLIGRWADRLIGRSFDWSIG